jgi:hypothetical protein
MICLTTILIINIVMMITGLQAAQRAPPGLLRVAGAHRAPVDLGEARLPARSDALRPPSTTRPRLGPGHLRDHIFCKCIYME